MVKLMFRASGCRPAWGILHTVNSKLPDRIHWRPQRTSMHAATTFRIARCKPRPSPLLCCMCSSLAPSHFVSRSLSLALSLSFHWLLPPLSLSLSLPLSPSHSCSLRYAALHVYGASIHVCMHSAYLVELVKALNNLTCPVC